MNYRGGVMEHTIKKRKIEFKDGFEYWYYFGDLNQEHRYIKIQNLVCSTDRKAINKARKIIGNKKAMIKIEEVFDE